MTPTFRAPILAWVSLIIGVVASLSEPAARPLEQTFDTSDATAVKNEIVSQMLDADFTLSENTQYKLVFAKPVVIIEERAVLSVSFTIVPQSDKTRVSAFYTVTTQSGQANYLTSREEEKHTGWWKEFFPRLSTKIKAHISSHSSSATSATPSLSPSQSP